MNFAQILKNAFGIVILKMSAMQKAAEDKSGLRNAILMVVFVSIVGALGWGIAYNNYDNFVMEAAFRFIISMFLLYLTGFLSSAVFKSKINTNTFVKVVGLGALVSIVSIYPVLSLPASLWLLVIMCRALHGLGKLGAVKIVVLMLINLAIFWGLGWFG